MDELRGPTIQIVLHIKEGLGFGFLRCPFFVSGSLNGYMLETDPAVPTHAPIFDAELVWEADKRRFRSLRVQNVPVKVEVFTTSTQGRKDKIGYLLLSLLGAQPCPANKFVDVKHSWHKLLGVKSEGKCCHPQLLMSLTIEDRVSTPTPRNELRMFHSNEYAHPSITSRRDQTDSKSMMLKLEEYVSESKKVPTSIELQPKLLCDEGLIQIGDGNHLFVLSLVIGSVENLDLLVPQQLTEPAFCNVTYSIFTHNITTDRVSVTASDNSCSAHFNQRTSLRVRTSLETLTGYFAECWHLVARVCVREHDVGICSMDLRKLIPTTDIDQFVSQFCNVERAVCVHERCFVLSCEPGVSSASTRRPYMDVELVLKYVGAQPAQKPLLTARSATQLKVADEKVDIPVKTEDMLSAGRAGSCTELRGPRGTAYSNITPANVARYTNASGDAVVSTNEITELLKKMCDTLASSQEMRARPRRTSDVHVQCDAPDCGGDVTPPPHHRGHDTQPRSDDVTAAPTVCEPEPKQTEAPKHDAVTDNRFKDAVNSVIPTCERDDIIRRFVEELEDWKEKQQQMFKQQLKRKEDYHLELLATEWTKRRVDLEGKLRDGVERCRELATQLAQATHDFTLRAYRNTERENKLLEAKKALECHYTAKYQELREASQKMEADMNHQLRLKELAVEEMQTRVQCLEKQVDVLKTNLKNCEKDAESRCSGLTKDQTASLIQELRCLEEKLESAVQSKCFFKEQWGRAVREMHLMKLGVRRQMLTQLRNERRQLADVGLDEMEEKEETDKNEMDLNKLKDDFYVGILANTPAMETHSVMSTSVPDGMEIYDDLMKAPKSQLNERLSSLISQRDALIKNDEPDENTLTQLNHEIRNMLINYGT